MSMEALACVQNALLLERQGRLREAEEWLTLAIHRLRGALQEKSLGNTQQQVLTDHLQDAALHLQRLRGVARAEEERRRGLRAQERPQDSGRQTPPPGPHEGPKADPAAHSPPAPAHAATPVPLQPQKPQPQPQPRRPDYPLAAFSAARVSDTVKKAIDISAILLQQQKYKQSLDVLQHAYDMGSRERNKPGNFYRIEEHLVLLRRKYYEHFKPRFLQDNPVLPAEMEVLRRSGFTETIRLPMWDDVQEGYARENVFMPCEGHWEDPFTPRLAASQRAEGAQYLRIGEIKPNVELCIISRADPLSVKQTVVGDCSMVCSLIICAAYQQRFPKGKIISNVIYPQDNNGDPVINPKGKYCVKMLINGITRLITVDDRFPASPHTGRLLCTYSNDETELWVSVMEKAFVKLCGGSYEFPGSSSSSDLYKLSGWLPDRVSLESKDLDPELQWTRLSRRHGDGSLLMTASTAALPEAEERRLRLVSSHAYAVLALREVGGERLLQLKNPWGRESWAGAYSLSDKRAAARALLAQLQYTKALAEQGVFWITWGDLCAHFSRCCLSWNPYMLYKTPEGMSRRPTRLSCHRRFPYTTSTGQTPQFHVGVINAPRPSRMHLVFARHVKNVEEFGLQFVKDDPRVPYVAVKVYDVTPYPSIAQHLGAVCSFEKCYCRRLAHGTELEAGFAPLHDVSYKNMSEHTLSFDCPAGTSNLLVVVSRTESTAREEFGFSLTLHTEWPQAKLNEAAPSGPGVYMHFVPQSSLQHCTVQQGRWEKGVSCGGRTGLQTFAYNPQYLLTLSTPSMLSVRLHVPDCDASAQLHVLRREQNPAHEPVKWSPRVGAVNEECSLVLHAPLYAHGGVVVDTSLWRCVSFDRGRLLGERPKEKKEGAVAAPPSPLPAGDYTVVPALWDKGVSAAFELVVETTGPHALREIVPEGVGFVETKLQGQLTGGVAAEVATVLPRADAYFSSNGKVGLLASVPCVLTGRLLLLLADDASNDVYAGLALFRPRDAATMERVESSGLYALYGVALPPVKLAANVTYVLVVSSAEPSHAKYALRLYSSAPIKAWQQ
ncbi:calpain protease-like protein [Trypanosoma conorhini]|uniref:Calpain protease-like protein n=1 Tax=Trypanosoma conorhini TaxID=83891 RepID=A0A422PFL8_9TRYP|nr:calpain protease-like protein [Trypanosoma conorhini]RNF16506.1 calpain protease-like protein [Trypanosoma conorhini]